MAEVELSVGEVDVQKEQTAPKFVVKNGRSKFGELTVSKGSVRWLVRGLQEDAHFINWKEFDLYMKTRSRK